MRKCPVYIFASVLLISSCKKNYSCECKNTYSTYNAGDIKNTKHKAKKQCESLSGGDTKCYLK
jgi:hypothetical protein